MRAAQQLAGHADMRMTQRYSHLAEQVLVAAVQTLPALPKSVDVIEQPPAEESARALEVAA
jgi:hypothetical protein